MTDVDLSLNRRTLLIGGNGTGKTSVLEAVDKVFGAGRRNYGFREDDLAAGAAELTVDFELRPDDGNTFSPEEHALFETHVDVGTDGDEVVLISVVAGVEEDGVFRTHGMFMKSDDQPDGPLDSMTRRSISFFYLPSARDARREFDDGRGLWARLAALMETAHDPDRLDELTATAGRDLVGAVLGEDRLDELSETVRTFIAAMYGNSRLEAELRATAVDFRDLLRRTTLVVGERGEFAPLEEQSTGLQTLALFGLFRAYLDTAGGHSLAAGLEEPEIHLAPHVARALVALATEPGNQVILTTHSPSIAGAVSVEDIRVLRMSNTGTVAQEILPGLFNHEELARLHRELRTVGTEFLFARAVLLCEGESERGALPEFAHKMGVDFDSAGVSILQVGGGGFLPYLKLLGPEGFDIPHAVVCDNDLTLKSLINGLQSLSRLPHGIDPSAEVEARTLELFRRDGYFAWTTGDLESYLVDQGGYEWFEQAADFLYGPKHLMRFRQRKIAEGVTDDAQIVGLYTHRRDVRKPELAAECASRFLDVPSEVAVLVEFLTSLSVVETDGHAEGT